MTAQPYALNANEPTVSDVKEQTKKEIMMDLQCCHPGVIEEFNASTQTATVKIVYKRTFFRQETPGIVKEELRPYPLLTEVPVIFLRGGQSSLRFPVAPKDECLVFFADRDIDRWLTTGDSEGGCQTLRMHSISDGFALVGVSSDPRRFTDFLEDEVALQWGEGDEAPKAYAKEAETGLQVGATKVALKEKITIENAEANLKVQLSALITQLTNLNTHITTLITTTAAIQVAAFNSAVTNAPAFPPIATSVSNVTSALGNIKTALEDLLE